MTIDEIWKLFGDDLKFVSPTFSNGEWTIIYDNKRGAQHVEIGTDMTQTASKLADWYAELHTYKAAAESLWNIIDAIAPHIDVIWKVGKDYDSVSAGIREHIVTLENLCALRSDFITKQENGTIVWNPAYGDSKKKPEVKQEKPAQPKQKKKEGKPDPMENAKLPDDGFPPYCMINNDNYLCSECWGHDVDGNRIHVNVNRQNHNLCVIDSIPVNANADMLVPISQSEFIDMYNEAKNIINAISMGYGVDDFTQYKVVTE